MAETEVVRLNLEGTFAAMAEKDAAAADKLAKGLERLSAAGAKRPKTVRGDVEAEIKAHKDAAEAAKKYQEDMAAAAKSAAKSTSDVTGKIFSGMGEGILGAAGPIAAGAAVVVAAAETARSKLHEFRMEAIALAETIGVLGGTLIAEGTSGKESFIASMEGMGKTSKQAEILYRQIAHEAIETGRSKDEIAAEYKRLANAGYKAAELEGLSKMLGDLKSTAGEGAAGKVEKALEKVKTKGSLDKGAVQALVKAGVSQQALYAELAKVLKKPVADIPGLIKAGKVDSDAAIEAITKTVEKKVGGAASKQADTILSLVARIKTAALEMFVLEDAQVKPLKNALRNVLAGIVGPAGAELKKAFGGLALTTFDTLLGPLAGDKGVRDLADFARGATEAMGEIKTAIGEVKPEVQELVRMARELVKSGELKSIAAYVKYMVQSEIGKLKGTIAEADERIRMLKEAERAEKLVKDLGVNPGERNKGGGVGFLGKKVDVSNAFPAPGDAANDNLIPGLGDVADKMPDASSPIGKNIADGMIQGIEEGSPEVVAAAEAMAERALEAAKARLGIHSPSTEFAEVGGFADQGMAKGMATGGHSAKAAAGMAGGALGAAQAATNGATGAGGGAPANSSGGPLVVVNLTVGAGATAAEAAAGKAEVDKGLPRWLAMARAARRG